MKDLITQLGVPVIVVILILREIVPVLKNNSRKNSKDKYVVRQEYEKHKEAVQYKDNCEQIVKRLDETNKAQEKRFDNIDKQFDEVKVLIRNNGR